MKLIQIIKNILKHTRLIALIMVPVSFGIIAGHTGFAQISVSLAIVPQGEIHGYVGIPFTMVFEASNGVTPYKWASDLPEWMDYYPKDNDGLCVSDDCTDQSPDKFQVSGVPPAPGVYKIDLAVIDQEGKSGSQTFELPVDTNSFADDAELAQIAQAFAEQQNASTPDQNFNIDPGTSFKYADGPAIYYLSSEGKELYTSMKIMDAWQVSFDSVITVPPEYKINDSPKMVVSLPTGRVVKAQNSTAVYEVTGAYQIKPFARLADFIKAGYRIIDIIQLESRELLPFYKVIK